MTVKTPQRHNFLGHTLQFRNSQSDANNVAMVVTILKDEVAAAVTSVSSATEDPVSRTFLRPDDLYAVVLCCLLQPPTSPFDVPVSINVFVCHRSRITADLPATELHDHMVVVCLAPPLAILNKLPAAVKLKLSMCHPDCVKRAKPVVVDPNEQLDWYQAPADARAVLLLNVHARVFRSWGMGIIVGKYVCHCALDACWFPLW